MAKKRKLSAKAEPAVEQPLKDPKLEPEEDPAEEEPVQEDPSPESEEHEEPAEPLAEEDPSTSIVAATGNGSAAPAPSSAVDAADGDETDPSSIQKLLESFPKDLLVEILRDAAVAHPDILSKVHQTADQDPTLRKIFVHGLGWDTTAETLISAFQQYGEIEDCNAVTDKITGKSKGYAFILFKRRAGARQALKEPQKKIGSRMTACQLASTGPVPPPAPPVSEYTQRKIFVSNVGAEIDPQKLLQFFAKYGEIEEGPLGLDKITGKPKGFALFVYRTVDSAKKALEEPHKNFEGNVLHCQKAIDGPKQNKPGFHLHHGGAHLNQGAGGVGAHGAHFQRNDNAGFIGGANTVQQPGHLMAPSAAGMGFNQAAAAPAAAAAGLNPAFGQALTAFLATQGAGLGLTSLLGSLGSAVNQAAPAPMANSGGYGNQPAGVGGNVNPSMMGGYGASAQMQGGYGSAIGQGSAGRGQQGIGHMGGGAPYMGR